MTHVTVFKCDINLPQGKFNLESNGPRILSKYVVNLLTDYSIHISNVKASAGKIFVCKLLKGKSEIDYWHSTDLLAAVSEGVSKIWDKESIIKFMAK
jgi:hypothetical protein